MIQLFLAITSGALLGWLIKSHLNDLQKRQQRMWETSDESAADAKAEFAEENYAGRKNLKSHSEKRLDYAEINRAYRTADTHFARGELGEAEKWFIRVIAMHEHHPEALNRLGVIYIQQNNPRRAEVLYEKLLAVHQKEAAYYSNYGRCLYNQGKMEEAISAYKRAVELDPARPARFVSLGQLHYECGEHPAALEYFAKAVELDQGNLEYLLIAAEIAEIVMDRERLIRFLKKIIELDPYNKPAREKLASFFNK